MSHQITRDVTTAGPAASAAASSFSSSLNVADAGASSAPLSVWFRRLDVTEARWDEASEKAAACAVKSVAALRAALVSDECMGVRPSLVTVLAVQHAGTGKPHNDEPGMELDETMPLMEALAAVNLRPTTGFVWLLLKVASSRPSSPGNTGVKITFEELLVRGGIAKPQSGVLLRARVKYGAAVLLALQEHNTTAAVELYHQAARLPSTTTKSDMLVEGYHVNGLLYDGSELTICYKGTAPYVLKGLETSEAARARELSERLAGHRLPHVTPFEVKVFASGKFFMIMPYFAAHLERIAFLQPEAVVKLWNDMRLALDALHGIGFAHMDVKPSNICYSGNDYVDAVLIDLGSVSRFGERTASTPAYVPRDVIASRASAVVDWWMLAMTLAEKGCGEKHGMVVGSSARSPTTAEVCKHLQAHLLAAVWLELELVLTAAGAMTSSSASEHAGGT